MYLLKMFTLPFKVQTANEDFIPLTFTRRYTIVLENYSLFYFISFVTIKKNINIRGQARSTKRSVIFFSCIPFISYGHI